MNAIYLPDCKIVCCRLGEDANRNVTEWMHDARLYAETACMQLGSQSSLIVHVNEQLHNISVRVCAANSYSVRAHPRL